MIGDTCSSYRELFSPAERLWQWVEPTAQDPREYKWDHKAADRLAREARDTKAWQYRQEGRTIQCFEEPDSRVVKSRTHPTFREVEVLATIYGIQLEPK